MYRCEIIRVAAIAVALITIPTLYIVHHVYNKFLLVLILLSIHITCSLSNFTANTCKELLFLSTIVIYRLICHNAFCLS